MSLMRSIPPHIIYVRSHNDIRTVIEALFVQVPGEKLLTQMFNVI